MAAWRLCGFCSWANAEKDKAKQDGTAPWFIAAQNRHLEVVRHLLEASADKKANQNAARCRQSSCTSQLNKDSWRRRLHGFCQGPLRRRTKANQNSATPLYVVAQTGQSEVVRLVLVANADKPEALFVLARLYPKP